MILLIISIVAAVLWLATPYMALGGLTTTFVNTFKEMIESLDQIGEAPAFVLVFHALNIVALIAIVLAIIRSIKKNANGVKKAGMLGLIGSVLCFLLACFLVSHEYGASFGDIFSGYLKVMGWGFWAMLVSFAAMIGVSSAANKD